MFQQIEEGQKVVNTQTKETGVVLGVGNSVYFVNVDGKDHLENWAKHDTYPFREEAGEKREQELVSEFHKAFKYQQSDKPVVLSAEDVFKRVVFIQEELIELLAASVDTEDEFNQYIDTLLIKQSEAESKEIPKIGEKNKLERIVAQADALTDINVFVQGTGDMMGVQLFPLFEIVMRANMSKLDENGKPIYNEFGKIQKSELFTPPEPLLEEEIQKQIKEAEDNV